MGLGRGIRGSNDRGGRDGGRREREMMGKSACWERMPSAGAGVGCSGQNESYGECTVVVS